MCFNVYDYTLKDTYPSCGMNWPYELEYMNPYLRRSDVLEAIHATDKKTGWTECNGAVSSRFRAQNSRPSSELFPDLLQSIPILLFSGTNDVICNHLSTEYFAGGLHWNGAKGFGEGSRHEWIFEGQDVGHYQIARNLTYVQIYNASHMVPYDKPRLSRDMLDRFMGMDVQPLSDTLPEASREDETIPIEPSNPESPSTSEGAISKFERYRKYYKAGSVALVVIILAVVTLGYCVYKHRGTIQRRYGFDKLGLQESGRADDTELEELVIASHGSSDC